MFPTAFVLKSSIGSTESAGCSLRGQPENDFHRKTKPTASGSSIQENRNALRERRFFTITLPAKNKDAVNPAQSGTKMAAHYPLTIGAGQSVTIKLRFTDVEPLGGNGR